MKKTPINQLLEVLEINAKNIQPMDIDDIIILIENDYLPLEKKQIDLTEHWKKECLKTASATFKASA